jgi:GGDEF domain-containing protein
MRGLRRSLIQLLLGLTLFFNIERLDFGQANIIDIQSFVYVLGLIAVLSTISLSLLIQISPSVAVALWLALFLLFKVLVFNERPVLGSIYTYLTVTEAGLITILVVLAYQVAHALNEYGQAVEKVMVADRGQQILQVDEAAEIVETEMRRSRHYHRALSVVVAIPEQDGVQVILPRLVQEAQQALIHRYAAARLADTMRQELRRMDTVLEDRKNGRFVILCPEVDEQGTNTLIEHLRTAVAEKLGISIDFGVSSFPDNALTFEELVRQAEMRVNHRGVKTDLVRSSEISLTSSNTTGQR